MDLYVLCFFLSGLSIKLIVLSGKIRILSYKLESLTFMDLNASRLTGEVFLLNIF